MQTSWLRVTCLRLLSSCPSRIPAFTTSQVVLSIPTHPCAKTHTPRLSETSKIGHEWIPSAAGRHHLFREIWSAVRAEDERLSDLSLARVYGAGGRDEEVWHQHTGIQQPKRKTRDRSLYQPGTKVPMKSTKLVSFAAFKSLHYSTFPHQDPVESH